METEVPFSSRSAQPISLFQDPETQVAVITEPSGKVKEEDPAPPVIDASFKTRIPFAKRETLAPFHPSPKASVMSNV